MMMLDVFSRVVHIATAIVLLGGSSYVLLVLMPELQQREAAERTQWLEKLRSRWQPIVHAGIGLMLLSGFYNYFRAMPLHKGHGLYHALIGTKILLAVVVFFLASVLVGRSARFETMRRDATRWLKIVCLLGLAIVIVSGYLKVSGNIVLPAP
ncbi:MAG: hypothetical protein KF752_07150 [Pirellulaceae bacterium]|nr:hypothetical protein [Pirellulaceae bacterium]